MFLLHLTLICLVLVGASTNKHDNDAKPSNGTAAHSNVGVALAEKGLSKRCREVRIVCLKMKPYAYSGLDGQAVGVDVEIWKALSAKLNLCPVFKVLPNPKAVLAKFKKREADLVIGQMCHTSGQMLQYLDMTAAIQGMRTPQLSYRNPQQVPAAFTLLYPMKKEAWIWTLACSLSFLLVTYAMNRVAIGRDETSLFVQLWVVAAGLIGQGVAGEDYRIKAAWQVKLLIPIWLFMAGNFLCNAYKGSLLKSLVAGQLEDPADTYQKLMERNMTFFVPEHTMAHRLLKNHPFKSMRRAYNKTVVEKNGLTPYGSNMAHVDPMVLEGKAAMVSAQNTIMGLRHLLTYSKKETPIGNFPTGFMYAKKSWLLKLADPYVLRLVNTGVYQREEAKGYWKITRRERNHYRTQVEDVNIALDFGHLGLICPLVFGVGVGSAFLAFWFELFYPKLPTSMMTTSKK